MELKMCNQYKVSYEDLGKDFEQDAINFALENKSLKEENLKQFEEIQNLRISVMGLGLIVELLQEIPWDKLDEMNRDIVIKYKEEARNLLP